MRYALLISLLIMGCGPAHYLQKAKAALKKAEQLGAVVKADTVYITRTVVLPEYKTDTVIHVQNFTDTIRIENERVKWKVKINTVEKKVFVEAKCKADTVIIHVPMAVTTKIKAGRTTFDVILLCLFFFIVGGLASKIFWK